MLGRSALAVASITLAGLCLVLRLALAVLREGFPHVDDVLEATLIVAAHVAFVRKVSWPVASRFAEGPAKGLNQRSGPDRAESNRLITRKLDWGL